MKNPTTLVLAGCVLALGANGIGAQDWPQWRGPNRDNKLTAFTVPTNWPKELTKKWKVTVGVGESSPVLAGDKIYVFSRQGDDEVTLCLDAASGKEVWKDKYAAEPVLKAASPHPGPRSTPAVGEGKVCTLGVGGTVSCLDAATGKVVWRNETKAKPQFYTSSSPMIVDGKCIVFVGALIAYDLGSGEAKWEWKGGGTPYGSPVLLTVDGTKQVVTPTAGALAGVGLSDGKRLWEIKIGPGGKDYQSNFSTPIIDGQTVIYSFAPKGKGGATVAVKIEKKADGFTATEVWQKSLAAHQYHTPVLHDGLLFGVSTGLNFFCMDARTGESLWTDKSTQVGKCGAILDAGAVLLALTSDKDLIALRPSKKAFEEVARYRVADAETWAVPIIAGNRVYVKDKGGSLTLWTIQ
jgi:outer membrane protein assembly factor BamB